MFVGAGAMGAMGTGEGAACCEKRVRLRYDCKRRAVGANASRPQWPVTAPHATSVLPAPAPAASRSPTASTAKGRKACGALAFVLTIATRAPTKAAQPPDGPTPIEGPAALGDATSAPAAPATVSIITTAPSLPDSLAPMDTLQSRWHTSAHTANELSGTGTKTATRRSATRTDSARPTTRLPPLAAETATTCAASLWCPPRAGCWCSAA